MFINKTFCLFTGWLDDIGLPQYKDYFYDARIDGRMLHFLTIVSLDVEGKNMQKTLLHYLRKSSIFAITWHTFVLRHKLSHLKLPLKLLNQIKPNLAGVYPF